MAETRGYGLTRQLDIEQILLEAQRRWLRPAEICKILQNYQKFHVAPEPPNRPPSGSIFLFDRKVLRYFRKDGHNWRKKKDGKTVNEAHEKLKVGSIDVLHCYYAHGDDNANFQRRSYWLLEPNYMHIVLVHYREVKNKESYGRSKDIEENTKNIPVDSPVASSSVENYSQVHSQTATAESQSSVRTAECEDVETDFQASSRYNPYIELLQFDEKVMMDANSENPYIPFLTQQEADWTSLNEVKQHYKEGFLGTSLPPPLSSTLLINMEGIPDNEYAFNEEGLAAAHGIVEEQSSHAEAGSLFTSNIDISYTPAKEGKTKYQSLLKQVSLNFPNGGAIGLQKHDSFSRWMNKELGEVNDSYTQSSSGTYWDSVESESMINDSNLSLHEHMDTFLLSPSLTQDQHFSINEFYPNWAYSGIGNKVLISGTFLKPKEEVDRCKWSCMFGEMEVPAEVLANGILQCHAPPHKSGRVPFYVSCSNRIACSEVRDFEYQDDHAQHLEALEPFNGSASEMILYLRLEKFLSDGFSGHSVPLSGLLNGKAHICNKISSLLMRTDDLLPLESTRTAEEAFSPHKAAKDQLLQTLLKEKLHTWLLQKVVEDGKGPNILDKEGQGVIHLAAALGYHWAIAPTIAAGVSINFRDVHGWTSLHWAAFCGRESTVITLLLLGAAAGALTDPTPEFPSGQTPADLASNNGHKGIAGFLAESSLTSHLSTLTLKRSGESDISSISAVKVAEDALQENAFNFSDWDVDAHSSMKDSLDAVRNAAQAAARIHQVFRVQSFHRKELVEYSNDKYGKPKEHALSLVSMKGNKTGEHDEPVHAAAIRIQNKFRGWKGRKEFLIIRQRIVKIQAHVRGHQVRKHFRKIVWSVGIVEKVILRWRRKGTGLRGFRSEGPAEGPDMQVLTAKQDDYDFLQEGRKQTEARLERALARVKSMVQYPEARDQYQRLLIGAEEFQESKVVLERILNDSEEPTDNDMMFELDELLGDDMLMPS